MAKTFYYDSVGLSEASTADGATITVISGVNVYSDTGDTITNENRINDQNISLPITGWANGEILQIDLGSSKSADFLAVFFNVQEADDMALQISASDTGLGSGEPLSLTASFTGNSWNVSHFGETSSQYWRIVADSSGGLVGLTEAIIGKRLEFEINPDLGISESEKFGTDVNTSIGGIQYGIKRHEPIKTTTLTFSSISSTFKSSLQAMQDEIQDYKKFIYSEDGTTGPFHYVRLGKPIDFKEVSVNRFSCTINLLEQLS
jgi:hypothetical protein